MLTNAQKVFIKQLKMLFLFVDNAILVALLVRILQLTVQVVKAINFFKSIIHVKIVEMSVKLALFKKIFALHVKME